MGAKSRGRHRSFIVRASRDASGEIRGIIELASTGAKEPFTSIDAVGRVIARMLHDLAKTEQGWACVKEPRAPPGGTPVSPSGCDSNFQLQET